MTTRMVTRKGLERVVIGAGDDTVAVDLLGHHPFHNAARAVVDVGCCVAVVFESIAATVSSAVLVQQLRALLKRRRPIPMPCTGFSPPPFAKPQIRDEEEEEVSRPSR